MTTAAAARGLRLLVPAALLALPTLTACSTAGTDAAAGSPSPSVTRTVGSAEPSPSPSPSPSLTEARPRPEVLEPLVDDATLTHITAREAKSAWTFSTGPAARYAFDPATMRRPAANLEPTDFAALRRVMSGEVRRDWDRAVQDVDSGPTAFRTVNGLATVGTNINGYRLRAARPVTGFTIVGGVLAFDDGDVVTTQTQTAVLHLTDSSGKAVKYTVVRTVTLTLGRVGEGWRITDWESESEPIEVVADA